MNQSYILSAPNQEDTILSYIINIQRAECNNKFRQLSRARKFSVLYFTVLFAWDVCDQTASWWFWQYTGDLGASFVGYSELGKR